MSSVYKIGEWVPFEHKYTRGNSIWIHTGNLVITRSWLKKGEYEVHECQFTKGWYKSQNHRVPFGLMSFCGTLGECRAYVRAHIRTYTVYTEVTTSEVQA